MRKKLFLLLKTILLFVIFAWIFKSVDIRETGRVLEKTNIFLFLLGFILYNLSNFFLTIKWHRLATPLNIKSDFFELLKLNYISIFYSIFVPGQASGELIKGLKLKKKEDSHQKVWVPIVIDKITNLLITLVIGFVAVLSDKTFNQNTTLIFTISLLTVFFSFITITLFSERTKDFDKFIKDNLVKLLHKIKINAKSLTGFSLNYFEHYKKNNLLIFETLFWSILVKFPHIVAFYFFALSLNISLSLVQAAWLFSIVFLVSILPISFSGLGVREGTILVLLSQIGIQSSQALSFSMLVFITGIIIGLIGGMLELISLVRSK